MFKEFALSCYKEILSCHPDMVVEVGNSILIPRFPQNFVCKLITETFELLKLENPLIYGDPPFVVVGDIHGNFHDLLRIFTINGFPPYKKYLFLGDYVDRGSQSLDVIIFLFVLKLNFPNCIYLLRGNHEFEDINDNYGFLENVMKVYNDKTVWQMFNQAFNYLPLCIFIGRTIFCVHGGISDKVTKEALEKLEFPITYNKLVEDMTWSDPSQQVQSTTNSIRGKGVFFGYKTLKQFFNETGAKMIIRGHQCVDAREYSMDKAVLTIFSSSNYGKTPNKCGYAVIDANNNVKCIKLPPFPKVINPDELVYYDVSFSISSPFAQPRTILSRVATSSLRRMSGQWIRRVSRVNTLPINRAKTHVLPVPLGH